MVNLVKAGRLISGRVYSQPAFIPPYLYILIDVLVCHEILSYLLRNSQCG